MKPSEATLFFDLLEKADGKVPHGTKELVADGQLAVKIARRLGAIWIAGDLFVALEGFPVRAVRGAVRWVEKEAPGEPSEQLEMIQRWASKRASQRSRPGKAKAS